MLGTMADCYSSGTEPTSELTGREIPTSFTTSKSSNMFGILGTGYSRQSLGLLAHRNPSLFSAYTPNITTSFDFQKSLAFRPLELDLVETLAISSKKKKNPRLVSDTEDRRRSESKRLQDRSPDTQQLPIVPEEGKMRETQKERTDMKSYSKSKSLATPKHLAEDTAVNLETSYMLDEKLPRVYGMTSRRATRQHRQLPTSEYYSGARMDTEISCCVKYTVFGFNVIFWIIGFAMLLIGLWAQFEKNNPYSQLNRLSKFYLDPALLLTIIGAFTFVIGFSGCVGALRENTSFLAVYSTLLGLLLLAEMIIVVLAFVSKDWIETELKTRLDDMVILYRDDPDLQSLIDWMQSDWKCCGINRPDDWDMNIYFNKSAANLKSEEAGGVPFSCCIPINANQLPNFACGHNVRQLKLPQITSLIYVEGCLPKLQQWLNNNFIYVGTCIFIVAIIQFLGICFAQDLKSDIFAQRAKWRRH